MGLGKIFDRLILIAALGFLCSCTTLHTHSQRVKLATEPEGAAIYFQGELIGHTPDWFEIPRQKYAMIRLQKKGYPTIYKQLNTTYRWGDSFFSDLIWLYGAPLGWAVDYFSGTAWNYDKVGVISFEGNKEVSPLRPPTMIAIAPPQNPYELLSNEGAERLLGISRARFNDSQFKEFDDTHNLFSQYGYTNDGATPPFFRDALYEELGASHIIESEVEKEGKDIVIKSRVYDTFTDKEVRSYTDKVPASSFKYAEENWWAKSFNYLVGVIPNTVSIDLSPPVSSIYTSKGVTYTGAGETTVSALSIISAIGFKSLDSPKLSKGVNPVFKLIPVLVASYDRFNFSASTGVDPANTYNFGWATIIAGFGPEVGLDTSIGYFYAEIAPALSMNWIEAFNQTQDTSARGSSLSLYTEFGYQIFASSRVNLRLFTRLESIPSDVWSQVLTQIDGQQVPVDRVTRGSAGLSIGYYFPEDRTFLKRAFFPY